MIESTETLHGYKFLNGDLPPRTITSIVPISEARARELFERRWGSSVEWTLKPDDLKVGCITPEPGEDLDKLKKFRVRLEQAGYIEVEVEAKTSKEARSLAVKKANRASDSEWKWDVPEILDVEQIKEEN